MQRKIRTRKKELLNFCKNHKYIYIYGAGNWGGAVGRFLENYNIFPTSYIVSVKKDNPENCNGIQVDEVSNLYKNRTKTGIILCLLEKYQNSVKRILQKRSYYDFFSMDSSLFKEICLELHEVPIIALLYHRVADLKLDPQLLSISVKNFEEHVKYLSSYFPILSFQESWKSVKEPSVIITFDDGYQDNFQYALPILQKYNVPATIFVTTGGIDKKEEFWWDYLENIFLTEPSRLTFLKIRIEDGFSSYVLKKNGQYWDIYNKLHLFLKECSFKKRKKFMMDIVNQCTIFPEPRESYQTMLSRQIKEIGNYPQITIGAHTVTHSCLAFQSIMEQRYEIEYSKKILEEILKKRISFFSYPFGGKADYTLDTIRLLQNFSFEKAASNFPGVIYSWTSDFEVPRNIVRNWERKDFQRNLLKFFN